MFAQFENAALTESFAQPVRYSLLSVLAAKYVSENVLAMASVLSTLVTETVENRHSCRQSQTTFALCKCDL